jgi:Domain of unknown function (DUF4389)
MTTNLTYPVHVEARLDVPLSRWLWLLKWLLVIPHYVVLAFLWLAFAVTSVIVFFAILFTGRYPRALFDFNVGVLRWSWRVAYYAYGTLGTDRYPPFTLHEVPDYPAHLEVDYPEHLSRGLVLVKWWLLAIPHYLVIGLFFGGIGYAAQTDRESPAGGFGLIGILVLIAGLTLLFRGRYPARLFDFVLGLNRWVLRVAGYVSLMTDRYPPFALDQGGSEQSGSGRASMGQDDDGESRLLATTPAAPAAAVASPPQRTEPTNGPTTGPGTGRSSDGPAWTTGRALSLIIGSVLAVSALGLLGAGTALIVADQLNRDSDGFLMSPVRSLETDGFAVTTANIDVVTTDVPQRFLPESIVGDLKLEATSDSNRDIFIGVAPTTDVDEYLGGVQRSELRDITDDGITYDPLGSNQLTIPPTDTDIWVDQNSGPGTQTMTWPLESGEWTVVIMNADGGANVAADVAVGAEVPALHNVIIGLFVAGAVAAIAAFALIFAAVRGASSR